MKTFLIAAVLMFSAGLVQAAPATPNAGTIINEHSGGTNADGCHNDHKRGTYHCH